MALTLKGRLVESLDHMQICKDLQSDMTYHEVAEKHGCSKGTIHRIVNHYDMMKYKKNRITDQSVHGKRRGWACGRPTAKYKGAYPNGFLKRLDKLLGITEEDKVLHLFSGSIGGRENEDTMDIQKDHNPTFVADARETFPMGDNTYDVLISDPPYDCEEESNAKVVKIHYSNPLWETEPVRPYSWMNEAIRVTKEGGYICVLHHLTYKTPKNCVREMMVSVTCGPNTRVRILSIFRKMTKEEVIAAEKETQLVREIKNAIESTN